MRTHDSYFNSLPLSKGFIWMAALILIAIIIRIQGTIDYHYSEDEAIHTEMAQGETLKQTLQFSLYEAHPPLGTVLRYYWQKISDAASFSRDLSLVFGIGLILVYYHIGKLLSGELAAMCCAWLAAFSYGGVIQSYIARNYTIFSFFMALALYYYFVWCKDRRNSSLAKYAICCVLAGYTHFSAILAIFSIAAYETLEGYSQDYPLRQQVKWAVTNILIAVPVLAVYWVWSNIGLVLTAPYFATNTPWKYYLLVLSSPIRGMMYVLPSSYIPALVIPLWFMPLHEDKKTLRAVVYLTLVALCVSTGIIAASYYYPAGTRHNIWLMPFIITAAGIPLANVIKAACAKLSPIGIYLAAIAALLGGYFFCSQSDKTDDPAEYQMKENDWQDMSRYVGSFGKNTLLIAGRDDALTFKNLYPYLGDNALHIRSMATMIPYQNTHILINPYYRRYSNKEIFMSTMDEAQKRDLFAGYDTFVFMYTAWDIFAKHPTPMHYLAECKALDKKITPFPASTSKADETSPVVFITVSKKDFFEKVLAPDGIAHNCLGTEQW